MMALDCAASEFYENGKYDYTKFEGATGKIRTSAKSRLNIWLNWLQNIQLFPLKMVWMKTTGMDGNT